MKQVNQNEDDQIAIMTPVAIMLILHTHSDITDYSQIKFY